MDKAKILSSMTLDEKIKLTSGNNMWTLLNNDIDGLREILLADGPHGVRIYEQKVENQSLDVKELAPSTLFPSAAGMASTFNEELIQQVGQTIAKECNINNVDVLLAPGVNLKRSPLAGRNFEYYSEDPYLTGRMATNFIKGVQSEGVGACIKHFALNEQENQRRFINSIIDERTLHELYLKPFKMAIDEAKPFSIMSSYNKVNNHYSSESKELLLDILRDKWHFDGAVISDWGAVQDKPKSLLNGMNIEMPGRSEHLEDVYKAIEKGTLTEEDIDKSLLPLFDLLEKVNQNKNKGKTTDLKLNHLIARKVSEEAIVLLKNDGILPIEEKLTIAVIGDFASTPRINGGGSATLKPFLLENPLEEFKKEFTVHYAQGYKEESTSEEYLEEVNKACSSSDIIIYFTGTTKKLETEGKEREHMNLPKGHIEVFNQIKKHNKKIITILNNGGAVDLSPVINESNALIESWFLGGANAVALVNIIKGTVNPSGRLSETIPLCIEHTPFYPEFPVKEDQVYYQGDITRLGYRYYDTHKYPVRFPFGFGLSYSSFEYSNLVLSKKQITDTETVTVSVDITNTSSITGKEVVQLYVEDNESYLPRPKKELKAFKKIKLQPNETKTVNFVLSKDSFSTYSVDFKDFRVESGTFTIHIGKNVNEILLKDEIEYKSQEIFRTNLTLKHPLKNYFIYQKDKVKFLEDKYRTFAWYEIEEPAIRVLKRLKRDYSISDVEYHEILSKLEN